MCVCVDVWCYDTLLSESIPPKKSTQTHGVWNRVCEFSGFITNQTKMQRGRAAKTQPTTHTVYFCNFFLDLYIYVYREQAKRYFGEYFVCRLSRKKRLSRFTCGKWWCLDINMGIGGNSISYDLNGIDFYCFICIKYTMLIYRIVQFR